MMNLGIHLILCVVFALPHPSSCQDMHMSMAEYFPEIKRELSKVTWAHAVNSHVRLQEAFEDHSIMMLEADILMGNHAQLEGLVPIMAHPPEKTSDLSFSEFLDAVIHINKEGKKKGIKLDFKEIIPVDQCLKLLRTRLEQENITFPIFVNADILRGPVNSTKDPIDPQKFISTARKHTPFAVLSVGWTTRYGNDDPSDEIRDGKYTRAQIKEMLKILREYAGDPPVFPHITFPVRAGLAAQSIEELLFLTARVRKDASLTLWSPDTDPVSRRKLHSLVQQQGNRHVFIDLPFSVEEGHEEEYDDHSHDLDPAASQHVEGRGQSENGTSSAGSSKFQPGSALTLLTVVGLISSFFYIYRRY